MISLKIPSGEVVPLVAYSDYRIRHNCDGCDELTFCVETNHEQYPLIAEECEVYTDDNAWLVKKIDDDKVDCSLNFDFLKTRVYVSYVSQTQPLSAVLLNHLPEGWTVEGASVSSISRTIEFEACTDYDVIYQCMDTYSVYFVWKILEKRLIVYDPTKMSPTGEYLTSELNLTKLSMKGSSTDFTTRLYCYGADGLTPETAVVTDAEGNQVEYGLPYVEDRTYADKVICAVWIDDRYTNPQTLYEDGLERLQSLSWPVRSYECSVIDLAKQRPEYSFLSFSMHKKITLVDVERGIKVEHQIVEYDEYPDEPERNKITLSCVPGNIETKMQTIVSNLTEEQEKASTSMDYRIAMATAMLTSVFGGYISSSDGNIYIADNPDLGQAEIVWRWNVNGFGKSSTGVNGPYTTALTFDDTFITNLIQAVIIRGELIEAESLTATQISQSYTSSVLESSFKAAEGLVEAYFAQLSDYLSNEDGTGEIDVLKSTITSIQQTIDGLALNFKEQYTGGINYVQNSAGLNGVSDVWETEGVVTAEQSTDTKSYTVSDSCFRLSEESVLAQEMDNIVMGESYSISLKLKKTSSLLAYVKIIYNGDQEVYAYNGSGTFGWTEFTATIDSAQASTLRIEIYSRSDYLYVSDIMICEGGTPHSWTPAPGEIYTSGTKIDKNGVEVYREGSNQVTRMTNAEFASYYGDEEVFSVNRDETRIKKTVVDGELTVGDCKFIPYSSSDGSESGLNITLID